MTDAKISSSTREYFTAEAWETLLAKRRTLWAARLFGKRYKMRDHTGGIATLVQWRGKTYFLEYTP